MSFSAKRKKMESLIYDTFSALDPSNTNTDKYKAMFRKMSDKDFDSFFKTLFKNENSYLILDTVDYENALKIEYVENAAKVLNIPLFERVVMPFANKDTENPQVTSYPVPVGYLHIKRMQQMLSKKNTTSTEIATRSSITGQVTGKDKNARESDQENFGLVALGANESLREFMGPRADDMVMKSEMYSEISRKGYVSLSELTDKVENKTTLNTVDCYFIGMGLKTDLVTDGLVLKHTLNN